MMEISSKWRHFRFSDVASVVLPCWLSGTLAELMDLQTGATNMEAQARIKPVEGRFDFGGIIAID